MPGQRLELTLQQLKRVRRLVSWVTGAADPSKTADAGSDHVKEALPKPQAARSEQLSPDLDSAKIGAEEFVSRPPTRSADLGRNPPKKSVEPVGQTHPASTKRGK